MKTRIHREKNMSAFKYLFAVITLTLSVISVEVEDGEGVAIGIDLGTTYCAFSYFDPNTNKIVMMTDEHGSETIPSVLFYDKRNGKMLVGREAKDILGDAENKVWDAKRVIGRKFSEKVVQNDLARWPFKLQAGPNDSPVFKPKLTKTEMEVFKKKVNKKGVMRPEEISATLLKYLKNNAERILGKSVSKAVITVPAYFNTQQRQATKDAGEMAGLNVLRVINEPTSAAIAFGLDEKKQDGGKSLIFDLGGGTFDVSVVEIDGGFFDVKSSHGDAHLGGQDFDKYLSDLYLDKVGLTAKDLSKNELNKLKLEAEKVKIELSKKTDAKFEMTIKGSEKAVQITRVEFEKVLKKKIKRKLERTIDKALKGAGIEKDKILNLVMIGGSTRIPSVRSMVKEHMKIEPYVKIDPDKAVAYGAGIQAAILSGIKTDTLEDVILLDVTPLDLGIETQGGIMATIIKMNEKIPIKRKQTFMPASQTQDTVVIAIYQGPNKMARKNNFLGKFNLKGIGKNFPEIDVEFEVDANGIVKVVAHEKGNDQKGEIILDKASTISEEEKERIIQEFKENEEQDKLEADITSTKQSIITQATRLVNENPNEELKGKVNEILNEVNLITEFDEDNLKKIKEVEAKFTSILQMAGGAAGQQGGAGGDADGDDDEDEDDDEDL